MNRPTILELVAQMPRKEREELIMEAWLMAWCMKRLVHQVMNIECEKHTSLRDRQFNRDKVLNRDNGN